MSFTKLPRFRNALRLIELQKELKLTPKEFSDMYVLLTSYGVIRFIGVCQENSPRAVLWQAVWNNVQVLGINPNEGEAYQMLKWEIESVLQQLPLVS